MSGRSLREYVKAQRQENCVVCKKLSKELLAEFKTARTGNIPVETVLKWLRAEHGIVITVEQWSLHARGQHK